MLIGTVAIVGRPNVGKSTVFNRMIGERVSIVDDTPGVTRDRIYGKCEWLTKVFNVIDTGGLQIADQPFQIEIKAQVEVAIEEADTVVMLCNGKDGVTDDDIFIARMLQKSDKKVILAVNKIDDVSYQANIYEFYKLGLGDPIAISGVHGIGIGDLLDAIVESFDGEPVNDYAGMISFAVIGRPNVGKSSLVNAMLNQQRVIVSSIEGTTRDAIDTPFERDGKHYVVVDTAGIRKKGKVYEEVEKYSVLRAMKAIDKCDVALFVLDGSTGITEQDKHVAGYAVEAGRPVVIVVNKWDAIEKDDKTMNRFTELVRTEFAYLSYAPILFISAKTHQRVDTVLPEVDRVYENSCRRIPTNVLNEVIADTQVTNPAPARNGKRFRVYYATQVAQQPPTFVLSCNDPKLMHFSYQRYLENQIREAFGFMGTPLKFFVRERKSE